MAFRNTISTSDSSSNMGCFGKLFISIFFSIFLAAGCFFFYMMVREIVAPAWKTRFWDKIDCTILQSAGRDDKGGENPFYFDVSYNYYSDGNVYTSSQSRINEKTWNSMTPAKKLVNRYPAGSKAKCYVNPDDPTQAVLLHGDWYVIFAPLFPMIFITIGGGGIFFVWFGGRRKGPDGQPKLEAKSTKAKQGIGCVYAFLSIFVIIGLSVTTFTFFIPLMRILLASTWEEVPCQIVRSDVRIEHGDDSTSYYFDVFYRYEYEGEQHSSAKFQFAVGNMGNKRAYRLDNQYKPGSQANCYVNPRNPDQAVIDRGINGQLFLGLIPIVFALFGGGIMLVIHKNRDRIEGTFSGSRARMAGSIGGSSRRRSSQAARNEYQAEIGPIRLKPATSPLARFIGILIFALIWNSIVVFLFMSDAPIFFGLIFGFFGVLIGGGAVHQFLALGNPRPNLMLEQPLSLGMETDLAFILTGNVNRIRKLTITLTGRESATYRRGTSTYTDHSIFHRDLLFETEMASEMRQGQVRVVVPSDTMHSFATSNNKIEWFLKIHGDIHRWPDVSEEFKIEVAPYGAREAGHA